VGTSAYPTDGFIARHIDGRYEQGQRSGSVRKHKFTQLSGCYVVSWEPGKSRELGALNLAMVKGGKLEYVGKVGTGITQEEFKILISSKSFPLILVRHLGYSSHGKLREPVFVRMLP
jgi:ATP-dependent DNA ligase